MEKDKEIIALCLADESREKGFRILVQTYQERIYRIIRQMLLNHEDANDVMQEVFIKVWKSISKFQGKSSLYTWIYRIAVNESLNYLKTQKRKHLFSFQSFDKVLIDKLHSDPYFDANEAEIILQKALLKLPDKQRLVFNLHYFEKMKFEDMQTCLNTSSGALRASYHIAVKKIKKELSEF